MWNIMFNKFGEKLIADDLNPKIYICDRFFTTEKYRSFSKLDLQEIVSVDSMLFPEKELLSEYSMSSNDFTILKNKVILAKQQILLVAFISGDKNIYLEKVADEFEFLGYDLADEFEISALTNCGGFDETFTMHDLNQYGLVTDMKAALKMKADLEEKNPDESHADCSIFAIWRRL